jgi:endogenous inhibitor of DNA gyrase (YacG/DUF329 family)
MIDLGKWASGAYVVPSPVTDAEEQPGADYSDDHGSKEHGKSGN